MSDLNPFQAAKEIARSYGKRFNGPVRKVCPGVYKASMETGRFELSQFYVCLVDVADVNPYALAAAEGTGFVHVSPSAGRFCVAYSGEDDYLALLCPKFPAGCARMINGNGSHVRRQELLNRYTPDEIERRLRGSRFWSAYEKARPAPPALLPDAGRTRPSGLAG
jgi:hypothetical protein